MRAALIRELGEPPVVGTIDEPERKPGFALIDVAAAALNPLDLAIASGRYYGGSPPTPYVPGSEGAGVVVASDAFPAGTRVRFETRPAQGGSGSLAELARAPDEACVALPPGADDGVAAGLGVAGLAAWVALTLRAGLGPGETVLVLGASGAVGQVAVQGAKLLGAGRVVAAGRTEDGLRLAEELGADATVQLDGRSGETLADAFRKAAGGEVDVVIDPVWGPPAEAALLALGLEGRLVNLGQSAGAEATFASAAIRGRARAIVGQANAVTPTEVKREAFATMLEHAMAGRLRLVVEEVSLEEIGRAWELQASSPHRKIVVRP